jgi:hypothetical protein
LSVYLTIDVSVSLPICLSVYLSVCLSIYPSIHPQNLSLSSSIYPPIYLFIIYLSVCLSERLCAELTASYQCVLRACHEKVMRGHTKCCTCHAKSSQQT